MSFCKFKFPCTFRGKEKQAASSFVNETDVNQEYMEAFRTKSYIDICDKVQTHINLNDGSSSSKPSSSTHDHHNIHLCDLLLEPQNQTITNLAQTFHMHHLILDFFEVGSETWRICEKLLHSIHQAKANHHRIERVIKLAQRVQQTEHQWTTITKELASYSSRVNPLSDFNLQKFPRMHKLLKRITTKRTQIKRKRKLIVCLKKTGGCALIALYTVLAVALLVLACHGLVGIITSPGLIACSLDLTKKEKFGKKSSGVTTSELKRVGAQLDVAAKAIYALIKDFDTMGCLVGRLHDEVEFRQAIARKCVITQKPDVLDEVMREFRVHEGCFLEQLEELEDHIYLCLLNVNRSRRLLVDEILMP